MPTTVDAATPTDVAGVVAAVEGPARSILPRGSGSKLGWGALGDPVDLELDLRGVHGVTEYNPGDLVVSALAGTPLATLQDRLAEHGQWLALDPPEPAATLGGIVAAGASGPRRHRYGTARDLLIGVAVVLADGTLARAGGKVVKNVAGYDLMKLFTGSLGTLGVIVETTWRLHPRPPARRVAIFPAYDGELVQRLLRSTLTPTAIEAVGDRLVALFESIEPSVVAQGAAAAALGADVTADLPPGFGAHPWEPGQVGLKLAYPIAALDQVRAALGRLGAVRVAGRVGVGVLEAALPAIDPPALDALRAEVAAHGGTVVVLEAPAEIKAGLDVWGPVGDALAVMRRVKEQFDPGRRLAPGRFVGGI